MPHHAVWLRRPSKVLVLQQGGMQGILRALPKETLKQQRSLVAGDDLSRAWSAIDP